MSDTLGSRLEALLEKNGVTQSSLARQLGIDQTAISRIIVREGYQPGAFVLYKIAKALGTGVDALLDGLVETAAPASVDTSLVARYGEEITLLKVSQAQTQQAIAAISDALGQVMNRLEKMASPPEPPRAKRPSRTG